MQPRDDPVVSTEPVCPLPWLRAAFALVACKDHGDGLSPAAFRLSNVRVFPVSFVLLRKSGRARRKKLPEKEAQ